LLSPLRIGDIADPSNGIFASLQLLLRNLIHPSEERILRGLLRAQRAGIKEGGNHQGQRRQSPPPQFTRCCCGAAW
jgi:hypothetical protein